jgi:hypothetical protein
MEQLPLHPVVSIPTVVKLLKTTKPTSGNAVQLLDRAGWKPLKHERPDLVKPIELFGTRAGWEELKTGGAIKMHKTWSPRVAPAVRDIHAFWLPHRRCVLAAGAPRPH